MSRPPLSSIAAAAVALGFAPALVAFGVSDMPSLAAMRASKTADIVGVWVLTWAVILLGVAGALTVSWLAWSADAAARRLEASTSLDDTGLTPGPSSQRAVA